MKETSEKARQTNKTTFEQNMRKCQRQQYGATGHSRRDVKLVALSLGQEKLAIAKKILGFWGQILITSLFWLLGFFYQS